ncbi:Target of rapamycin complex subunit LST8 [Aphelenchoides besseyi]|nr:Target of rapamycin complex subunit LST8 [Aphelenchoides besseyi]KAI6207977.1 Target of rapamycin complex subunit LST8 [Aphelenchoides besseyi]
MSGKPLLISAAQDATIRIWDAVSEKQTDVITHKDSQVNNLTISPDGLQIAAASWERVRLYDLNHHGIHSGQAAHTFTVHEKNVTTLGYQAEGDWIFTGGEDGMAKIWDMRANPMSCQRIFQVNTPVHCVALHPNQIELIVADSTGALYLWDLRSDRDDSLLTEVDLSEYVVHVEIDQTGRQCAAVTNRGHLFIWNIHSGTLVQAQQMAAEVEPDNDDQNVPDYSSFTDANGQPLMVMPPLGPAPPLDNLSMYNQPFGVMPNHINAPYTLMSNIRPSAKIVAHKTFALKCHFTPDGLSVATTSADQTVKIWSATEYKLLKSIVIPGKKWVWECAFTNDSKYMITASSDALLRMYDLEKSQIARTYQGHSMAITAMAFKDANY